MGTKEHERVYKIFSLVMDKLGPISNRPRQRATPQGMAYVRALYDMSETAAKKMPDRMNEEDIATMLIVIINNALSNTKA